MSLYLNSIKPFALYRKAVNSPYFVDKSALLKDLFPLIGADSNYVCITRPRRFGKTVMANMIASYFSKGADSHTVFDHLEIAKDRQYQDHLNHYNVINIDFSVIDDSCHDYNLYISNIKRILSEDLQEAFPECQDAFEKSRDLVEYMERIYTQTGESFIFVLDEWDAVFHMPFMSTQDTSSYLRFLKFLLKDKVYVSLVYMTGILPIAKYSSGSELNMFTEYTMVNQSKFSEYFGFTDSEVDMLYQHYLDNQSTTAVSREGLCLWYDGYHTASGVQVYNPRSIVLALSNNQLSSYWTSSGPYDEIFYYVKNNIADVRDDLALLVADEPVPSKIEEYASVSMELKTKSQIFSAMVVYGFLTYDDGNLYIPNKELMDQFVKMLQKEESLGYVYNLAKASDKMLSATLHGDTATMVDILSYAHNTEVPLLSYNHEVELTAIVNLVYLSARDRYFVERENKAGTGFVDFIFFPYKKGDDCIILELKVDHSPEEAIQQIKEKNYALRFKGKLGEDAPYTGRILAVGIGYSKKSKKHSCKVEQLE